MNIQNLKARLHKQIDALDDAGVLQLLHDAAVDYNSTNRKDILDELTDEQKQRLENSLQQAARGKTIPHEDAMQLISEWRKK